MPVRTGKAVWNGSLEKGGGKLSFGDGLFEGAYSAKSRFEDGGGTNPDELLGAAHAACFSMALAHALAQGGHEPESVRTAAKVRLEKVDEGFEIMTIELDTEVDAPGLDQQTLLDYAMDAKTNCPVSKALAGPEIKLNAKLKQ